MRVYKFAQFMSIHKVSRHGMYHFSAPAPLIPAVLVACSTPTDSGGRGRSHPGAVLRPASCGVRCGCRREVGAGDSRGGSLAEWAGLRSEEDWLAEERLVGMNSQFV